MTNTEFAETLTLIHERCVQVLAHKGADYADGGDRLSQFKCIAADFRVSPRLVWAILLRKQVDALCDWARKEKFLGGLVDEHLTETINLCYLGYALQLDEKQEEEEKEQPPKFAGRPFGRSKEKPNPK